jgi:hypothetical protein
MSLSPGQDEEFTVAAEPIAAGSMRLAAMIAEYL